jgi:hypothetical protein
MTIEYGVLSLSGRKLTDKDIAKLSYRLMFINSCYYTQNGGCVIHELDLSKNLISDVSKLSYMIGAMQLSSIKSINLSNNQLCTPISYYISEENLTELDLSNNKIINIDGLSAFQYLKYLDLSRNLISDLSALEKLVALENLDLRCNPIVDLGPLKHLGNLTHLSLDADESWRGKVYNTSYEQSKFDHIVDIGPLANLNITHLYLGMELKDLVALRSLHSLQYLYLEISVVLWDWSSLGNLPLRNLVLKFSNSDIRDAFRVTGGTDLEKALPNCLIEYNI